MSHREGFFVATPEFSILFCDVIVDATERTIGSGYFPSDPSSGRNFQASNYPGKCLLALKKAFQLA